VSCDDGAFKLSTPRRLNFLIQGNEMTETVKRFNSTLLDATVLNALRKYSSVATQQGRTDRATLALELLSKFDKKSHAAVIAQHVKSDAELVSALQTYREAVESQGRGDRVAWVNASFAAIHADALADLRDEFNTRIAELAAMTTTKKR
jgi:hypothetical protein